MSKKHFIELADMLRATKPKTDGFISAEMQFAQRERHAQWEYMLDQLANFCAAQNSNFKRNRWLDYIAGDCGPNGGAVVKRERKEVSK